MIPVHPISVYYQGFSPIQRILESPKIDQAIFPHFYKLKENGINHFDNLGTNLMKIETIIYAYSLSNEPMQNQIY